MKAAGPGVNLLDRFLWIGLHAVVGLLVTPAQAFDKHTHETFVSRGIAALSITPALHLAGYDEGLTFRDAMQVGATTEDDLDGSRPRVVDHFYHAPTGRPLSTSLFQPVSARSRMFVFWPTAINAYGSGDRAGAYEKLGHVLHLVAQDMASPPHVHDDIHFRSDLGFLPVEFGNPNGYEAWAQMNGNKTGTIQASTVVAVTDPAEALVALASETYTASRIPGAVAASFVTPAGDVLGQMFPAGSPQGIQYIREVKVGAFGNVVEERWSIPQVGDMFLATGRAGNPGISDDWWKTTNFLSEPATAEFFYVEDAGLAFPVVDQDGRPSNGKSLAELQLTVGGTYGAPRIQRAIEYSAGVLKLFHDVVNAPPFVQAVAVEQPTGTVKYAAAWTAGQTARSLVTTANEVVKASEAAQVRITFSEAVAEQSHRCPVSVQET